MIIRQKFMQINIKRKRVEFSTNHLLQKVKKYAQLIHYNLEEIKDIYHKGETFC